MHRYYRFFYKSPSSDRNKQHVPSALTRHVPSWSLKEWVPSGTKGRGTYVTYAGHESGHSQRHCLTMTDNCLHEFCCVFTVVHRFAMVEKNVWERTSWSDSFLLFYVCYTEALSLYILLLEYCGGIKVFENFCIYELCIWKPLFFQNNYCFFFFESNSFCLKNNIKITF